MITSPQQFAAVRETNGRQWIDLPTMSPLFDETMKRYKETDAMLPGYAEENPVVRIAACQVQTV
jgi:hypothetical protein